MKNIIQSFLPASSKELKQKLYTLSGVLLLLFIFIISSIGKNKVTSKNTKQTQKKCETKMNTQIAPEFARAISKKANDILFQSVDGGNTWQNLSAGFPEDVQVTRVITQGNEVFAGTGDGAVYHCYDMQSGGWVKENIGGFFKKDAVIGIFPGRFGPYVSVYHHGFFKRIPGTGFWQAVGGDALKELIVHDVLEKPDGSIFVASGAGIFKSTDDGNTWKHVFTTGWVTSLAATEGVMVAAGQPGLMRSTDGEHWECVLPDEAVTYKASILDNGFSALRLSGPWPESMKETPWQTTAGDIRLRTSADGGKTWQGMNAKGLAAQNIYDLEQAGKYLFASQASGIYRSADGGKTWELIRPNTDPTQMNRIDLISSDNVVYAVMARGGC